MSNASPRIVTLIASATEIVAALGARDAIVGRSHECDFPADVAALPALTGPKFPVTGSSGDIDARVRAIVAEGLSVYWVDAEALRALCPDVIVTQDHCDVCAVSLSDVEAAVCGWAGPATRVLSLKPDSLEDIYTDIANVAGAIGRAEAGTALIASMRARLAAIADRTRGRPRARLAFIEWGDPLMSGSNWMPTLFEAAGATSLFGVAGQKSTILAWDDLAAADPDVIVIAPCGFDLKASEAEHASLALRPQWQSLKAVRGGEVYCADGNAYFNRPGPRVVETAEIVAEIVHPGIFAFGHEGRAWRRVGAPAGRLAAART